jgi:hypothetical protein
MDLIRFLEYLHDHEATAELAVDLAGALRGRGIAAVTVAAGHGGFRNAG